MLKVAVIAVLSHKRTVQSAVPAHPPPLHPAKLDPACGTPESVMLVPQGSVGLQAAPLHVTLPFPAPALVIVRAGVAVDVLNVVVTV